LDFQKEEWNMAEISIFGKGNMGSAIGGNFEAAGNQVTYITKDTAVEKFGDIVVLSVPYPAIAGILTAHSDLFAGKIVIDITNPLNFETFDSLVVPADSSAAAEIAKELPDSSVIKAFNTTFAATLATKKVAGVHPTTVLMASDDKEAKDKLVAALEGSGLAFIDVGLLKRARELEAMGFLQISLAAADKISWTGGFGIFH
jgi:predicted dinucleotide-binding enzyme